jgi:hypothetical protein
MTFNPVTIDVVEDVSKFFKKQNYKICDYTAGGLFMWKDFFSFECAVSHDTLIVKSKLPNGTPAFLLPIGPGPVEKAFGELEEYCAENALPLIFYSVTEPGMEILRRHFKGDFDIEVSIDWDDYVYNREDLLYLKGKKYDGKRNHISRFMRDSGGYTYHRIEPANISRVSEFFDAFLAQTEDKGRLFQFENAAVKEVLENYERLDLVGGFIETKDGIAAFSIGEIVCSTFYVHIEKANRLITGAYAVMNRDFIANNTDDTIRYINREEDSGDLGLRKAKMSYHPAFMLKKHLVTIKGA